MNNVPKKSRRNNYQKTPINFFQGGYICIIILKTFFLDLMENRLLNIWKSLSVSDENVGKTTELFDISTIVYGQGNVLRAI